MPGKKKRPIPSSEEILKMLNGLSFHEAIEIIDEVKSKLKKWKSYEKTVPPQYETR